MFKWFFYKPRVYAPGYWVSPIGMHGRCFYHDKYGVLEFACPFRSKGPNDLYASDFPDLPERPKEELVRRILIALHDAGYHEIDVVDDD